MTHLLVPGPSREGPVGSPETILAGSVVYCPSHPYGGSPRLRLLRELSGGSSGQSYTIKTPRYVQPVLKDKGLGR